MKIEYIFSFIILVLIAALRYRVGGDSLAYENYFTNLPSIKDLAVFDFQNAEHQPAWYIFNALVKSINNSFITFQFIHALIINSVIFWFINKYTKEKWLTLIFYFCFYYLYFNMEILRESLAISVFLLSIPFLLNKKWLLYILFCVLATSFHISAIVTLFFPFLLRDLKVVHYILIYLILTFIFIYSNPNDIMSFLNFSGTIGRKASSYTVLQINIFGVLAQLIKITPIIVIYYLRKKNKLIVHPFHKLVNIYIVLGLFSGFIPGFYRFQNYLSVITIVYIADSIVLFKKQKVYLLKSYVVIQLMIILLFINQIYYLGRDTSKYESGTRFYNLYLPYHSIFNPKIEHKRERLFFNSMEKD